jgi:hypothetical protein
MLKGIAAVFAALLPCWLRPSARLRDPYPREAEGELYHHIAPRLAFQATADAAERVRKASDSFEALEPVALGER